MPCPINARRAFPLPFMMHFPHFRFWRTRSSFEELPFGNQSLFSGFGNTETIKPVVRAGRHIMDADADEQNMPFWAVQEVEGQSLRLPGLETARTRFMRRVFGNYALRRRWESMLSSVKKVESENVFAHFEQTTGHSVFDLPVNSQRVFRRSTKRTTWRPQVSGAVDGALKGSFLTPYRPRLNGRVLAGTFAVYLLLLVVGAQESRLDTMKVIHGVPEYSWVDLGRTPRGGMINRDTLVSWKYVDALRRLRLARTSVWGFFPGIEDDLLQDGIMAMETAVAFQWEGGYVYSEALLMLAKAYLDAGQEEKAVPLIEEVIEIGRRKAVEVQILKFRLQKKGFIF